MLSHITDEMWEAYYAEYHSDHTAVAFWQCRKCRLIHPVALDASVRSLTCTCKATTIINKRQSVTDPQSVQWYDKPVL